MIIFFYALLLRVCKVVGFRSKLHDGSFLLRPVTIQSSRIRVLVVSHFAPSHVAGQIVHDTILQGSKNLPIRESVKQRQRILHAD